MEPKCYRCKGTEELMVSRTYKETKYYLCRMCRARKARKRRHPERFMV